MSHPATAGPSSRRGAPPAFRRLKLMPLVWVSWGLWAVTISAFVGGRPSDNTTVAVLTILADVSFAVGSAALVAYLVGRVLIALEGGPYSRDRVGADGTDPGHDWYGA